MENNETLRKMRDMRLSGMADAYSEQLSDRLTYQDIGFEDRLGMLIDAELDKRQATKLTNLIKGAKLRFGDARSESVIYDAKRNISKGEMLEYFRCNYIEQGFDIVITGPTGSGKSWLSCALAMSACKHYYRTRYVRMPDLLSEFSAAKIANRFDKVLTRYKKYELLVLDEFMLNTTTKEETRDLYELIEARSGLNSTIYCSQYLEAGWLKRLGGGTSAEGIVDRITNNAYKIVLNEDINMRAETSKIKG